jgi:hypothetical protein
MIKKIGTFFEEHVEKIVLIVVGLICSWLLITHVLLSPNVVEYNGNNYSPGEIDQKIYEDAMKLRRSQPSDLETTVVDIPQADIYAKLFEEPISDVAADFFLLTPPRPSRKDDSEIYGKPEIGKVTNVAVEYMRTVAYEPVVPVTRENPYEDNNCEPNDVDFVTVQGNYDIARLYVEFRNVYRDNVSDEYNPDPCNTIPVFACVKLQRQQLNPDGSWSDWKNISRAKNDYNRDLFKVVESSADLPMGGLPVYKFQLKNKLTQLELLQPEPYQIASAKDEWFPPTFHADFDTAQKKDERQAREAEVAGNTLTTTTTTDTTGRRGRGNRNIGGTAAGRTLSDTTPTTRGRRGNTRPGRGGVNTDTSFTTNITGRRSRGGRTNVEQTDYGDTNPYGENNLAVNEVYDDFQAVILTPDTDLSKMSEPILLWAFDDTVQPENTYRYRIQLGVLNPVATENSKDIVYWSDFSDVTDEVQTRDKMYFFASSVKQAAKTVTVSIYKLVLGYWHKEDFMVSQGEMIGDVREVKIEDFETETDTNTRITAASQQTETVNFNTGAIMVDVTPAYQWSETSGRTLGSKPYYDMMYSYDGTDIRHMPVTTNLRNWPDLYEELIYVQGRMNEKPEPLKDWGASEIQLQEIRSGLYMGRRFYMR